MKQKLVIIVCMLTMLAGKGFAQSAGTEGTDFWITFLAADRLDSDDKQISLKLSFSSTKNCVVTIENPQTGYRVQRNITANQMPTPELLYTGTAKNTNADKVGCYTIVSEQPVYTAVHVTSTENISLFASNYKEKSFDATNVLPTTALTDNYLIQTFPASDHDNKPQGSHFAVVAVEDNTIVDIKLTEKTDKGSTGTITTPQLKKGQVYYIWTGRNEGDESDLSGTQVVARDGKKIAVFQGNPHTNLPYYKDYGWSDYSNTKDRDHLYSQAIPTAFWGTKYAITESMTRKRDIIRIMAINDGTEVRINGNLVHTFNFASDKKQYWEFEIGQKISGRPDPLVESESCFIETSCPTSVHLFMTSNKYDGSDNADPAMVVINPIEQGISHVTFTTYGSRNTHYVNIVTEKNNCKDMTISYTENGQQKSDKLERFFEPVEGSNDRYWFARLAMPSQAERPYTLEGKRPFVAHAYGYGEKESYGYSVGSAAVEKSIIINGDNYINNEKYDSLFCISEEIEIEPYFSVNVENVSWEMGDGVTIEQNVENASSFTYKYESPGWYDIKAITHTINSCDGSDYKDTVGVSIHVLKTEVVYMPGTHDCIDESEAERGVDYPVKELREVKVDCSRVEITPVEVGLITRHTVQEEIVGKDSCLWLGKWYFESGEYTDTIVDGNYMNCDSIVTCNIKIIGCLRMDVRLEKDTFCADDEQLNIYYNVSRGSFSKAWLRLANGKEVELQNDENGSRLYLPLSELKADIYDCQLIAFDEECEQEWKTDLHFVVRYASNIFRQKWNDVLVVPNASISEYDIVGFQWLKNGKEIEGATGAWYYAPDNGLEDELDSNAEYSIRLTRSDSVILESCAMQPQVIGEGAAAVRVAPTMMMPSEKLSIETTGEATAEIFNTLGVKESSISFTDNTEMIAPAAKGVYILHVTRADGKRVSRQLVVK